MCVSKYITVNLELSSINVTNIVFLPIVGVPIDVHTSVCVPIQRTYLVCFCMLITVMDLRLFFVWIHISQSIAWLQFLTFIPFAKLLYINSFIELQLRSPWFLCQISMQSLLLHSYATFTLLASLLSNNLTLYKLFFIFASRYILPFRDSVHFYLSKICLYPFCLALLGNIEFDSNTGTHNVSFRVILFMPPSDFWF